MRWRGRRQSTNIERRRGGGRRGGAGLPFGLGRGRSGRGGKLGGGSIVIVLIILGVSYFTDINLMGLLGGGNSGSSFGGSGETVERGAGDSEQSQFLSAVLGSTEDVWSRIFAQRGETYKKPVLVDYQGGTQTACGHGDARMGPFYCPTDQKIYLDQSFYQQLATQYGAPGDFAQAYVLAHEVGHHVQTLWDISKMVRDARRQMSKVEGNKLSVRQELQADCFSGVWAHYAEDENWLEPGDLEEGLKAASAVGDDTLQQKSRGKVVEESFTHGSAEQRQFWFKRGYRTGKVEACDTLPIPSAKRQ